MGSRGLTVELASLIGNEIMQPQIGYLGYTHRSNYVHPRNRVSIIIEFVWHAKLCDLYVHKKTGCHPGITGSSRFPAKRLPCGGHLDCEEVHHAMAVFESP